MVAKEIPKQKWWFKPEAGRDYFKRTEGSNLKSPVSKGTNPRRVSFAARFAAKLKDH